MARKEILLSNSLEEKERECDLLKASGMNEVSKIRKRSEIKLLELGDERKEEVGVLEAKLEEATSELKSLRKERETWEHEQEQKQEERGREHEQEQNQKQTEAKAEVLPLTSTSSSSSNMSFAVVAQLKQKLFESESTIVYLKSQIAILTSEKEEIMQELIEKERDLRLEVEAIEGDLKDCKSLYAEQMEFLIEDKLGRHQKQSQKQSQQTLTPEKETNATASFKTPSPSPNRHAREYVTNLSDWSNGIVD